VSIEPFTPGTTDTVRVTAVKIKEGPSSVVQLRGTDVAGNSSLWDPVLVKLEHGEGTPKYQVLRGIPQAEGKITLANGRPGLGRMRINVNGVQFRMTGLRDGEERTLDVSSAMRPGRDNVITLIPVGRPGSAAVVIHG
jgi:hypothetical protein